MKGNRCIFNNPNLTDVPFKHGRDKGAAMRGGCFQVFVALGTKADMTATGLPDVIPYHNLSYTM